MRAAARAGLVANGVVHILIGSIAFTVARGGRGSADQTGALGAISHSPGGNLLLWISGVALAALALWQLTDAAWVRADTLWRLWFGRLSYVLKASAFAAISWATLFFASGGRSNAERATRSFSEIILGTPGGVILLCGIGAIVAGIGVSIAYRGISQRFREEIDFPGGVRDVIITVFGVAGHIAKGIAFVIVGILFVLAAVFADAQQAGGIDGALKYVAGLPAGTVMLTAVAAGFVMYGFYLFSRARYLKREGPANVPVRASQA